MKRLNLKKQGAALHRLLPYIGRHWPLLVLSILLSAAAVILHRCCRFDNRFCTQNIYIE